MIATSSRAGISQGATDFALAMIDFESLAAYEAYRARSASDPGAQQNIAEVSDVGAIRSESRLFLRDGA